MVFLVPPGPGHQERRGPPIDRLQMAGLALAPPGTVAGSPVATAEPDLPFVSVKGKKTDPGGRVRPQASGSPEARSDRPPNAARRAAHRA